MGGQAKTQHAIVDERRRRDRHTEPQREHCSRHRPTRSTWGDRQLRPRADGPPLPRRASEHQVPRRAGRTDRRHRGRSAARADGPRRRARARRRRLGPGRAEGADGVLHPRPRAQRARPRRRAARRPPGPLRRQRVRLGRPRRPRPAGRPDRGPDVRRRHARRHRRRRDRDVAARRRRGQARQRLPHRRHGHR